MPSHIAPPGVRHHLVASALVAVVVAGCGGSGGTADADRPGDESVPPPPPAVASASTDTAALDRVFWDVPTVQVALQRHGLDAQPRGVELAYSGLSDGTGFGVGPAEVHVFIFGDIAAADAAYRGFDPAAARPVRPSSAASDPVAFVNNNMVVVVFAAGDATLKARLVEALEPPPEHLDPADAEP